MSAALDHVFRSAGARIIAALAARFRDLDLAEEAFAEACTRAVSSWTQGAPSNPQGWLYVAAQRRALDLIRKRRVHDSFVADEPEPESSPEEMMIDESRLIPDERLRLIFVCCHPAIAPDARAVLTLRIVCGLTTAEIARAFIASEAALAQRLVRAKRKITEAGVPFEIPPPQLWAERLDSVLSTLEVAYSKAHEDAAGAGPHAGYAAEMLRLTRLLADLLPDEADVLALAALVRFAEARRPARIDKDGCMVPLSEQDPARWDQRLIDEGHACLKRAFALTDSSVRLLNAAIHAAWCQRAGVTEPPPWAKVLALYDALLELTGDPIVRLNRTVALAEVEGVEAALIELGRRDVDAMREFLPYRATRADLLRRAGRGEEARLEYDLALALGPTPAEADWLVRQRASCDA